MTISAEREAQNKKYRRNKKLKHYAFVGFTFSLLIIFLILSLPPKEVKTIQGKALRVSSVPAGELGNFPRLFLELENGKKVTAKASRQFLFKEGAKVKVTETTSYLGFKTYAVLWNLKD